MPVELPVPIAGYFAADRGTDSAAVAMLFAEDAIVTDEGRAYSGRDAIRGWKTAASAQYTYSAVPFAVVEEGRWTVVTAHLTGDFPGSPVDLRYRFALGGGLITELEIAL